MPLAVTQEGDAPGSRAPALRRGRSSAAAAMPTRTTRSMALVRTRRQPSGSGSAQEPSARSKRRKRKRRAASNQRNKQKRTREEEEEREEEEVSSAGSSPLRVPHIRDEMYLIEDLELGAAIMKAQDDYSAKLARQTLLPTLHLHMWRPPTCMVKDPNLLRNRESATTTVLSAAPSVIGLSSSVGGLTRCSGFWVDWDGEKELGTVLTTAHLIRTKSPSLDAWLGKDDYDRDAEVLVHLRDDTVEKKGHHARLLYYQKHYNIALFEVKLEQPVQVLHLNGNVKCAEEVFELGRDESSFLTISHGTVQYRNSNLFERYHYLYVHGASEKLKYDNGGPVINSDGKVVGMVSKSTSGSFVPSSILLKCLDLLKEFGRIPRPQLGLKFSAIKFLDPPLIEQISCKCNIADGLIIEEVSEGSPAEKLGFRLGDVIECVNGERISTTVELENLLLSKCKDGISGLNSKLDLEIGVFHVRRKLWRSKKLSVEVSEDPEVMVRGGTSFAHQVPSFCNGNFTHFP
uniref:Uncharacterized protein n=1 Tax=Avena sativa TaxID=4498 RepID=A0ACD5ZRD1_AVESA